MRDDQVLRLVELNMDKVYLLCKKDIMILQLFNDTILYHVIPYRLRVLKLIWLIIINPLKAQSYITDLYKQNLKEQVNDNKQSLGDAK